MAAKESKKKVAAQRDPVQTFRAGETVHSWLRLATEVRGGKKNNVRLQLSINLNKLVETQDAHKEELIESLVKLVDTAYVDATLMLTAVEPGSGHRGGIGTYASGESSESPTEPGMETGRSSLPIEPPEASKV